MAKCGKNKRKQVQRKKRLPKYDLAIKPQGRQQGQYGIDTTGFGLIQGDDISGDIQTARQSVIPNAISRGSNLYTQFKPVFNNLSPLLSTNAAIKLGEQTLGSNVGSTLQFVPDIAGATTGQITGNILPAEVAKQVGREAAKKSITQGIGTAASVVGGLYSGYNLINDLSGFNTDYRREQDIMNSSPKITQSINGVNYDTYGGIDTSAEEKYLRAQNTGSTINTTMSGAGLGASVGSIIPGVGTLLGGAIGAIGGLVGGLLGGSKRKRKVREAMERARQTQVGYNDQSESIAASQGLRNQFNTTHADNGMDAKYRFFPIYNTGKTQYGIVHTPNGKQYGPINSLAGKNETMLDYENGSMHYINEGKERKDNQPTIAKDGDNIAIAGNDIDMTNGMKFSDQVAPLSIQFEKLKSIEEKINKSKGSKATKELNLRQLKAAQQPLLDEAKNITDRQNLQHQIEGKQPITTADSGMDSASMSLAYLPQFILPFNQYKQYKNIQPYTNNTYVSNPVQQGALDQLAQIKYDPYVQLQAVNDQNRQALYRINQGGYSGGQRMLMNSALNAANINQIANIYDTAQKANNQYRQQYAQELMKAGEANRQYMQQALDKQQENYRQAVAARRLGMETAQKGMLNIGQSLLSNLWKQKQFNKSQEYLDKILPFYINENGINKDEFDRYFKPTKSNNTGKLNIQFPKVKLPKIKIGDNVKEFIKGLKGKAVSKFDKAMFDIRDMKNKNLRKYEKLYGKYTLQDYLRDTYYKNLPGYTIPFGLGNLSKYE